MTNPTKSLYGTIPYSTVLARYEYEAEIATIPLKKDQFMEITNIKLSIYNSKGIISSIPTSSVRSITPIKKDRIRMQFYEPKTLSNGTRTTKRKYSDYKLEKNDFSADHICRKIQKEHERLNTKTSNRYGFLMVHGWEHIISVYHDVRTNKGEGMLYVTNFGLALETDEGIVFDVPYERVVLVTNKKEKVRIVWNEAIHWGVNHHFDLQMCKETDSNVVRSQIRRAFSIYRKKTGQELVELEKKYGKIPYDEMCDLVNKNSSEFQRYVQLCVDHVFGYSIPIYDELDAMDILSCKLAGVDIGVIKNISKEEDMQRKQVMEFFIKGTAYNKKHKELYDVQLAMEAKCEGKEEFAALQKDNEYIEILARIDDLKSNPGIPNIKTIYEFYDQKSIYIAAALRSSDEKIMKIYKKWIEDVPLIDCKDDYDDAWVNHLLEKLDCKAGRTASSNPVVNLDELKESIKGRDRNRVTLRSFVPPRNIPAKDVYNNCWHDRANKVWYVYDDNISKKIQDSAMYDQDQSQERIGKRVWGFSEDMVVMFCGFPSVRMQSDAIKEGAWDTVVGSRETGRVIGYPCTKTVYAILSILRECDITAELMDRYGSFLFGAEGLVYTVEASGWKKRLTAKMYEIWIERYDFAKVSIAERTRRALFTLETSVGFDPTSTVDVSDVRLGA